MKKTVIFLMSAMLVTPCFAEGTMSMDISVAGDIISGNVILPEAEEFHELRVQIRDSEGELNFLDIVYTDEEGKAEFKYYNLGSTGEYTVNVYSPAKDENIDGAFTFFDSEYRDSVVSEFNNLTDDGKSLSEFIDTYIGILTVSDAYNDISDKEYFDENFLKQNAKAENISDINISIADNIVLTRINQSQDDDYVKELLASEYKDYLSFVTDEDGEPLVLAFNSKVQKQFFGDIIKNEYFSREQLEDGMKTALLINAIEHANYYSEVMLVLKAYEEKEWINLSDKYSMEKVSKAIVGKSYSSLEEVEDAYNDYEEKKSTGNSSGGGSSGRGSSGGSSSGVALYAPDTREETVKETAKEEEKKITFTDVELTLWAEPFITKAVEAEILSGMGDGTFKPFGNLTRAEAAVIMTKLAKLDKNAEDFGFSDVKPQDWYYEYVGATCNAGIFYGISDTIFGVNEMLTREQAAAVFWRYLKSNGFEPKEKNLDFDDSKDISPWAEEAIESLIEYKVIAGKTDSLFAPDKPLLRAEAAVIISRILDLTETKN